MKWQITLGIVGLCALPIFGAGMLFIDSFRADGHRGWYHWLPPMLHFLHPPFFHQRFYLTSAVLGAIGALVGYVIDKRRSGRSAMKAKGTI